MKAVFSLEAGSNQYPEASRKEIEGVINPCGELTDEETLRPTPGGGQP